MCSYVKYVSRLLNYWVWCYVCFWNSKVNFSFEYDVGGRLLLHIWMFTFVVLVLRKLPFTYHFLLCDLIWFLNIYWFYRAWLGLVTWPKNHLWCMIKLNNWFNSSAFVNTKAKYAVLLLITNIVRSLRWLAWY